MYVDIQRTKIDKKEENRVKSHLIYEPHKRQKVDNLKFHKDGIFSKTIFGNFNKCECGRTREFNKICPKCGVRVIDPNNIPDFYIDLTVNVPVVFADYRKLWFGRRNKNSIDPDIAKEILQYNKFLYIKYITGENDKETGKDAKEYIIYDFDPKTATENYKDLDQSSIYYGTEALKLMGASEEWINENTTNFIEILHPMYRPLVSSGGMSIPFITGINVSYSNIIKKINDVLSMRKIADNKPFFMMVQCKEIVRLYNKINDELFKELQDIRYSIIKSELISHPISGAVRAVLTNRHDIHEDVLIIGDTLVETLWPYLYEKYEGNMIKINKELIDKNYLVLVNRPPTINHLSIVAMKPRIASIYPFGHTEDSNMCLDENKKYIEEQENKKIGILSKEKLLKNGQISYWQYKNFGDVEKFGQGYKFIDNNNDILNGINKSYANISKENNDIVNEVVSGNINFDISDGDIIEFVESNNIENINNNSNNSENKNSYKKYNFKFNNRKNNGESAIDVKELNKIIKEELKGKNEEEIYNMIDGIDVAGVRCIGMNPIVMDGLSADTDGDVLLVIALYSNQSNYEAAQHMLPSNSFLNYANGTIRNHIIEDFFFTQE